jgi:hypothetical protein
MIIRDSIELEQLQLQIMRASIWAANKSLETDCAVMKNVDE